MLTEEAHAAGVGDRSDAADSHPAEPFGHAADSHPAEPFGRAADKLASHEEAAHEKRNWVRLTFDCNDRCVFCLDAHTHDGTVRDREAIKQQILDGRRKGATRLILSGGEPTIHPDFVDFVRLGRVSGYAKIQTVTNGRMFAYRAFLERALDAGLGEITFSLHGPDARVHDALVGTRGAFDEEIVGLEAALADGRPIVNVDIVVNRGNVKHLPRMLRMLTEMGVREFDLLQVVPFGRAFTEGRDTLFYDLEEMRPYLQEALAYSKRPDVHLWMNRFPPQHLEGYEHLIQDPYKLNDEVRGRQEEYARLLEEGTWLDCRQPERCSRCYLERLCDTLEGERQREAARSFEIVRVDTEWEAIQPARWGGDPASRKRAAAEPGAPRDRRRLPMAPASRNAGEDEMAGRTPEGAAGHPRTISVEGLVESSAATTLHVVAPDLERALAAVARFPSLKRLELRLHDYSALGAALHEARNGRGPLAGVELVRAEARGVAQGQALLAIDGDFEVCVDLTQGTAAWLEGAYALRPPSRVVLRQPTYARRSEAAKHDVELRPFFARLAPDVPVEGVAACMLGREPKARPEILDTAMRDSAGRLEIFRFTSRYIHERYRTRSLRCSACSEALRCDGMHVNFVRAHGYGVMQPMTGVGSAHDSRGTGTISSQP
jgi:MoaA/NifB/PqqE/SkfB family radical SAM enzyme